MLTEELTFVYGDTHDGSWGKMGVRYNGQDINIRIYNCGGWVAHNENDHPACHIFAVDKDGKEYLLDISYKNVEVLGEPLLELASIDAENRYHNTSRILRFFLDHIS